MSDLLRPCPICETPSAILDETTYDETIGDARRGEIRALCPECDFAGPEECWRYSEENRASARDRAIRIWNWLAREPMPIEVIES